MHLPGLRGNPYGRQPTAADIGANHHGHSRLVAYPARLAALSVTVTVPKRVKAVPKTPNWCRKRQKRMNVKVP
jgi:hypothetical protein